MATTWTTTAQTSGRMSRQRRRDTEPELGLDDVVAAAKKLNAPWKLSDLASQVDRDTATTRNYVTKLVASGLIKEVGEDAGRQGRPAKLYDMS